MGKVAAINGSPNGAKGSTGKVLAAFLEGMSSEGWDVDVIEVSRLDLRPCTGQMRCWYRRPGTCHINDDMQGLYPRLAEADLLVLATPVYIPLPGMMQTCINRLCPLMEPVLQTRDGRTRIRVREHVRMRRLALVSTSGWWEVENFGTVVRIAEEFALNAGVGFTGAILRPHAFLMEREGKLTDEGAAVADAVREAGRQAATREEVDPQTLEAIARPLTSQEELRQRYNALLST